MIKKTFLALLFMLTSTPAFYASECYSSSELEFRALKISRVECEVIELKRNHDKEPIKYVVPDFIKVNSLSARKVLQDLKCEEVIAPKIYKGSYGFVRLTDTKACKLSTNPLAALEENDLKELVRNVSLTPVQGLSLCLPYVTYRYQIPKVKRGDCPFRIYVSPRVKPVKLMYDVAIKAFFNSDAAELNNLASFTHCLGVMQATSAVSSDKLIGELVCDAHFDLGLDNIIMTREAQSGAQGAFTLIDVADFVRGTSNRAPPLSVDITYFYLRSLTALKRKLLWNTTDVTQRSILLERYTFRLYQGYFSGFPEVWLTCLNPIFTTLKAFDLFQNNTVFGKNLFNGESESAKESLEDYKIALPHIIAAYSAVTAPLLKPLPLILDEMLLPPVRDEILWDAEPNQKRAKPEDDESHPCDFALPLEMLNIRYPLYKGIFNH